MLHNNAVGAAVEVLLCSEVHTASVEMLEMSLHVASACRALRVRIPSLYPRGATRSVPAPVHHPEQDAILCCLLTSFGTHGAEVGEDFGCGCTDLTGAL